MRSVRRIGGRALVVALVGGACASLAGCGGDAQKHDRGVSNCRAGKIQAYGASLVYGAYEKGKLGSQKQLEHELDSESSPGRGKTFFDQQGHLIPFARLDVYQQSDFNNWMSSSARVEKVTGITEKIARHLPAIDKACSS